MPRAPRIEYPGAVYHVMSRGNRREEIFKDDQDRQMFLETLGEACEKTGWILHGLVLMTNHYHWLLETPEANLSDGMRWFQGTYATRYARRHGISGHVLQGRFKSPPIDPEEPEHFRTVSDYIHLNPARAGMLKGGKGRLSGYRWSSFPLFLRPPSKRPGWLRVERVLGSLGLRDRAGDRGKYGAYLERRARECVSETHGERYEAEWRRIRRCWYIGGEAFGERLGEWVERGVQGKKRSSFGGGAMRAHDEQAARRLLENVLGHWGVDLSAVKGWRKSDIRKQGLAWLLRSRTTMTNEWVSRRLNMGDRATIYRAVQRFTTAKDRLTRRMKTEICNNSSH